MQFNISSEEAEEVLIALAERAARLELGNQPEMAQSIIRLGRQHDATFQEWFSWKWGLFVGHLEAARKTFGESALAQPHPELRALVVTDPEGEPVEVILLPESEMKEGVTGQLWVAADRKWLRLRSRLPVRCSTPEEAEQVVESLVKKA